MNFSKKIKKNIDGVLLLDKPLYLSSNQALKKVQYLFSAAKAGHTGTLDPLATGLLPICFGQATKFAQGLLNANKSYLAQMHLGITTTTSDAEGEIMRKITPNPSCFNPKILAAVLQKYTGNILQTPSVYSAIKLDGQPLYKYARRGIAVNVPTRKITIYQLDLLDITPPFLKLNIICSKGTYIRTLVEDIAKDLGCGAHLSKLRRTGIGGLKIENALAIDDIEKFDDEQRHTKLLAIDILIQDLPKLDLNRYQARRFSYGQRLDITEVSLPSELTAELLRVYCNGKFLGIANVEAGLLKSQRLMTDIPEKTLHEFKVNNVL